MLVKVQRWPSQGENVRIKSARADQILPAEVRMLLKNKDIAPLARPNASNKKYRCIKCEKHPICQSEDPARSGNLTTNFDCSFCLPKWSKWSVSSQATKNVAILKKTQAGSQFIFCKEALSQHSVEGARIVCSPRVQHCTNTVASLTPRNGCCLYTLACGLYFFVGLYKCARMLMFVDVCTFRRLLQTAICSVP